MRHFVGWENFRVGGVLIGLGMTVWRGCFRVLILRYSLFLYSLGRKFVVIWISRGVCAWVVFCVLCSILGVGVNPQSGFGGVGGVLDQAWPHCCDRASRPPWTVLPERLRLGVCGPRGPLGLLGGRWSVWRAAGLVCVALGSEVTASLVCVALGSGCGARGPGARVPRGPRVPGPEAQKPRKP